MVQEEMSFKEKVYAWKDDGRTDDGQRPITIAHIEPSTNVIFLEFEIFRIFLF